MMEMMAYTAEELDAVIKNPKSEVRDLIAAKALKRSMKDDDAHADLSTVLDRTEGKVAQDFNVRAAPTLTPEQVAEQVKNAGLLNGPDAREF